jgi:allantoinase
VETCPHYLHFAAEDVADGSTLHKCAPPIRSRDNRERLWNAIWDGDIDLVATDHSPCPPEMKRRDTGRFDHAWGGIASLSVALPVMWTGLPARGLALNDLARLMAEKPAILAGIGQRKGKIATGYDADLVIFHPEAETEVTTEQLHTRHRISPYVGQRLLGRVMATYLRGREVFREGEFASEPFGIQV